MAQIPVVRVERANGQFDEVRGGHIVRDNALIIATMTGDQVGYSLYHVASWSVTYEEEAER